MGKAEQRKKDTEMAARLRNDPHHKGEAVRKRKEAQHKERMRKLLRG